MRMLGRGTAVRKTPIFWRSPPRSENVAQWAPRPTSRCAKALEADCASMTVPSRSYTICARDRGET